MAKFIRNFLIVIPAIVIAVVGMAWYSSNVRPLNPNNPIVIPFPKPDKIGMLDCDACAGSGTFKFKSIDIECPKCNGFGKINHIGGGEYEPYSKDFVRGYKDNKEGVSVEDNPFVLQFRKRLWREGWEEAAKK